MRYLWDLMFVQILQCLWLCQRLWIKEQALELTRRKILADAFNYSLVLDSRSVYFYVENPHLLLPHGCFCQLCASVTNKCTLNESLEQEFGDLIHFFIHFLH